jgi:hypothetical protein
MNDMNCCCIQGLATTLEQNRQIPFKIYTSAMQFIYGRRFVKTEFMARNGGAGEELRAL